MFRRSGGWHHPRMAFRDDRDALRARAEALESDIADLQQKLERASDALLQQEEKDDRDEAEMASLRDEVQSLRKRLGVAESSRETGKGGARKRKQDKPDSSFRLANANANPTPALAQRRSWVFVGVATAVAVVGAAAFVLQGSSRDKTPDVGKPTDDSATVEPPKIPTPGTGAVNPPPPAGPQSAVFAAEVVTAEGLPLEPGSGCVFEVGLGPAPSVQTVRLVCGAPLYDSTMSAGTEMTVHESSIALVPDSSGLVERLSYRDTGMRTGMRPQLRIDSLVGSADIWRDTDPAFRLHLRVDDRSAAVLDTSAQSSVATDRGFRLHAVVTHRSGPTPTIPRDGCDVFAHPDPSGESYNCRVLVSCGGDLLYGARNTGYNACTIADQTFDVVNDEGTTAVNADPILHLERAERRMTVADGDASERWELQFRLEPDARCALGGHWTGALTNADGTSEALDMTTGEQLVLTRATAESPPFTAAVDDAGHVQVDCEHGEVTLVDGDTRWEGSFGPGFGTIVGRVRGGDAHTFWLRRE